MTIDRIIEVVKKNDPDLDLDLLRLAFDFAKKAHGEQKRMSGEPYIQHPLEVAHKLAEINLDLPTIIAGILHDVPEDTNITFEELEKNFGKEIANLVKGVTKLGTIKYRGLERYAENLRKMFIAMAEDVRVIFIKFSDRLHNLKTLYALPKVKQQRIAQESLEIYAPIANRLGMDELKGEIEDLAFPYLYPEEFKWVKTISQKKYTRQKKFSEKITKQIKKELEKNSSIKIFKISGRSKKYYSLYKKLLKKDMDIDKIYDLIAVRIIVKNISDCYHALGHIHKLWTPLPGRIKDYIAQPKPNGYQSIHTTVFGPEGKITEFQIRTKKMHEEAEWGVAAHWRYKENSTIQNQKIIQEKIKWIKNLLEEQKKVNTPKRYLNTLKLDFFKNRIFAFTPKGDVIDLPENATPIDFAYHIHTEVGHKCSSALINDKIANLQTPIKNGDVVQIITEKNRQGPSQAWLSQVKTHYAKNKIKQYFSKQRKKNIFNIFHK